MITSGEGRYKVTLEKISIGPDLLYILKGGEKPHIGGMILCTSKDSIDVIRLGTHHDHIVLEPIAKKAWEKYKTSIAVVGGIHIENATKEEIDTIVANCRQLHEYL